MDAKSLAALAINLSLSLLRFVELDPPSLSAIASLDPFLAKKQRDFIWSREIV